MIYIIEMEMIEVKITRFKDIPKFTKDGHWQCDFDFKYLLKFIDEHVKEYGLELNPDFQRGHVWTEKQQIAWIEFFLRGGKTGRVLYFNCPWWQESINKNVYHDFVCVDGLQRLTAIKRFMNGEIPAFGSYIGEYTDKMSIVNDTIKVNINNLKSKKEVLQWYVDMNAGGTPHTNEEIQRVQQMINEIE
jgi:uncharacterized protein with ParB-like and HNH nuclease domain|nr:MAG TPA: Protein of unknown function DUF262 [Caudoviricetes sp.]